MKAIQQFLGGLPPNVLLDKVNYECGVLEGQFFSSLESKFHIRPPKCESKLFGNRTVCNELLGNVKKVLVSILDLLYF